MLLYLLRDLSGCGLFVVMVLVVMFVVVVVVLFSLGLSSMAQILGSLHSTDLRNPFLGLQNP